MDHTVCQHSLYSMLKFFLLAISYCWTANHKNFKLQKFLRFICITVFCFSDLKSAVWLYRSFPVLKPAHSPIHTESYQTRFHLRVLLLCLWVNFSNIMCKETKDMNMTRMHVCLTCRIQFPFPWKTCWFECLKNSACELCYKKNIPSCSYPLFFLNPIPSALARSLSFCLPTMKVAIGEAM